MSTRTPAPGDAAPARLLLIRHGRTRANAAGILAGRAPGVDLDWRGRRHAASLGARLAQVQLDVVVHSPLSRCQQTAAAIVARQPAHVPQVRDERLVECDYGDWTGEPLRTLAEDPLWRQVQATPSAVTFPGGEAMSQMAARAVEAVADWTRRHSGGVVAMVSHADVIRLVLAHYLGMHIDLFQRLVIAPASASILMLSPEGTMRVVRVNDDGPLQPPPAEAVGKKKKKGKKGETASPDIVRQTRRTQPDTAKVPAAARAVDEEE